MVEFLPMSTASVNGRAHVRWPGRLPPPTLALENILWSVQARHLEEASFCVERREATLDAPHYNLNEIERGPERRLFDHLEGLRRGGPLVGERILIPALAEPEASPESITAAALGLLGSSELGPVFDAVHQAQTDSQREGIARALELGAGLPLRSTLVARLLDAVEGNATTEPKTRALFLRVLANHGIHAAPWLAADLNSGVPELARAAAYLARRTSEHQAVLAHLATSEDPELRRTTIASALVVGLRGAVASARYWALRPGSAALRLDAASWVALFGSAAEIAELSHLADEPGTRGSLLWALGYCGRVSAVDLCVDLLDDPEHGRLAAEAICAITGLSTQDDLYWIDRPTSDASGEQALPELEDDDLDADLVPTASDALPYPNPDAIRTWWAQSRADFDPQHRYLGGRLLDVAGINHALEHGPARRRHLLAFELEVRTGGRVRLDTRAWTWAQRASLREAVPVIAGLDLQRSIS